MNTKLSEKEYKKLVIEIAVNISPVIIEKEQNNISAAEKIASLSKDIAISINKVLESKT
jgi:hypothetical protein